MRLVSINSVDFAAYPGKIGRSRFARFQFIVSNVAIPGVGQGPKVSRSILIVCLSRVFGGADVRVIQTAEWLQANGFNYSVAVLQGSQLHNTLERKNLSVHAFRRGRGDPRLVLDLLGLAREAAVIDLHNMQSQYWGAVAAMLARVPRRIATVHSVYRETHPDAPRRQIHEGAIRFCKMAGFRFLVVSPVVEAYLQRDLAIAPSAITLSLNGIEPLDRAPAPCPTRHEAGWPDDTMVLGMIGRLEAVKGHRFLFEALARLRDEGFDRARLFVVGTGRDEAHLRDLVARHDLKDIVHFAGFRKDIGEVLAGIDLLCQPSESEGLPYSVLEACRQGVPVLASDLPGFRSVLEHGKTALLVPPGDVDGLIQQVRIAARDETLRKDLGEAARQFVRKRLSVDAMMAGTLAAYGQTPPA